MNQCCQIIAGQLVCLEWLVHDRPEVLAGDQAIPQSIGCARAPFKATCRWDRFLIEHDVRVRRDGDIFAASANLRREILRSDRPIPFPYEQSFGEVLQLADVPGPCVCAEDLVGLRCQLRTMQAMRLARLTQVVSEQQHHVFRSLAKRWNVNLDDVQTEVQVLTENARVDAFTQIAVGSGDQADIGSTGDAVDTDRLDFSCLRKS